MAERPQHTFVVSAAGIQWRTVPGAYTSAEQVEAEIAKRNPLRCTKDGQTYSARNLERAALAFFEDAMGQSKEQGVLEMEVDLGPTWDLQHALRNMPQGREIYEVTIQPEQLVAVAKVAR